MSLPRRQRPDVQTHRQGHVDSLPPREDAFLESSRGGSRLRAEPAEVQQRWNAELYDARHAFVFEYGRELLALLEPKPGERGLAAWIAMFFASAKSP
jgi:hypothetical protein